MNAPALYRYAPALEGLLAGVRARYVLQGKEGDGPANIFLIRMETPRGTLVLSLHPGCPALVLLPEGKSPQGEKTPAATRLEELVAGRAPVAVRVDRVDRSVILEWEENVEMRVDLFSAHPAAYVSRDNSLLLTLPGGKKPSATNAPPSLPGGERPDIFRFDPSRIPDDVQSIDDLRLFLRRSIASVPAWWIDEIAASIPNDRQESGEIRNAAVSAWETLTERFRAADETAFIYRRADGPIFSPIPLLRIDAEEEKFPGIAEAAAAWWVESFEAVGTGGAVRKLITAISPVRKKLIRLVENLKKELAGAERHEEYRRLGEILSIHFHTFKRGAESVRLPDPYEGGETEIRLDPKKTPRGNIERYFRLARKGERAVPLLRDRIEETREKIRALDEIREAADGAESTEEINLLVERAAPILQVKRKARAWKEAAKKPKDKRHSIRPREYVVSGGYTVLVGRDNKENDILTLKIARPRDIWFHASQSPGSHVIILRDDPKKAVPGEALLEAAAIAAHYSRARHASKVPVIYTEKRHVRKPKGSAPGRVTCTREKTLFVEPGLPEQTLDRSP